LKLVATWVAFYSSTRKTLATNGAMESMLSMESMKFEANSWQTFQLQFIPFNTS